MMYQEFIKDNPLLFTIAEVTAIYRIIEHEWINRDDPDAMDVADRISRFVRETSNGR
jgi:hypothetical protein